MSVADYNTDPDSNTSISGINIAEGCPPSGINNAIRQMMADIKTADNANVKLSGDQTIAGVKTFSSAVVAGTVQRAAENDGLILRGGTDGTSSVIVLYGKSHAALPGVFRISANDGNGAVLLQGNPNGTLTWDGHAVVANGGSQVLGVANGGTGETSLTSFVRTSGAQTVAGVKTFSSEVVAGTIQRDVANDGLILRGGTDGTSSVIVLYGKSHAALPGVFRINANKGSGAISLQGSPNGTLTWNGQTVQTTSDERLKTPLAGVPDAVLDAWGDVGWGQFQYLDAVEEKGADRARQHLGLIAQRVKAVFEARGLDACVYGILCHEERPATDEEPAVDLWMVRYTEALCMEAAYQRRRADRAEARLADIEVRLSVLEAKA